MHIFIRDFENRPLQDLIDEVRLSVNREEGRLLSELTYAELYPGTQLGTGSDTGIYWFSKNKSVSYVGSTTSRAFVERMGGHLASRGHDFMNSFLKHIWRSSEAGKAEYPTSFQPTTFNEMLSYRLSLLHIPCLAGPNFKERRSRIQAFEKHLQMALESRFQHRATSSLDTTQNTFTYFFAA